MKTMYMCMYMYIHAHLYSTCIFGVNNFDFDPQVSKVEKTGESVSVHLAAHTEQGVAQVISDVNCVLWAIGRDANLTNLGLDSTG